MFLAGADENWSFTTGREDTPCPRIEQPEESYQKGQVDQGHFSKRRPSEAHHEEQPPELVGLDAKDSPVNAANTRLSVNFFGPPSTDEPGNSWILDYAPDYSWAIIGNATGTAGTILTRDQFIPQAEYDALLARAYRPGVRGTITPTAQYAST